MKGRVLPLALLFVTLAVAKQTSAQTSAFTYQGRLNSGGTPASGSYDLRFTLYDSAAGPNTIGVPVTNGNTSVSSGLFSAALDFGYGAFTGGDRWLEIAVRPVGTGQF